MLQNKEYQISRAISDSYLPTIKTILANYFNTKVDNIRISTFDEDYFGGFDLVVDEKIKIAVRNRSSKYLAYSGEFTVRLRGTKTELDKIQNEEIDYIFYSFVDMTGEIIKYWLMSVNCSTLKYKKEELQSNCSFAVFGINPRNVVASSEPYPFNCSLN